MKCETPSQPVRGYQTSSAAIANLRRSLRNAVAGFAPPPAETTTEWAEKFRVLTAESGCATPGPYRVSRTPYAREVMDQLGNPRAKEVVFMSSAQVGKTTIAENIIGKAVHRSPVPIMIAHKRADDSEKFSKERVTNLIETIPQLRERFAKATSRSSGNTILHKRFRGGSLTMAQSNSPDSLRGRPIGLGIGDEVSSWENTPQGDPVELFEARMIRFPNAQRFYFSTPGTHGKCKITEKFELSDKRYFFAPCPHCSEYSVYAYEPIEGIPTALLKWDDGPSIRMLDGRLVRTAKAAWFECPACKGKINDAQRAEANRAAEWRATAAFSGSVGFWCWEANHPESTALSFADRWLGALGDVQKMQSVKNQVFGMAWKESGQVLDWKRLYERRESYDMLRCPAGVRVLFAGADVQPDRIEVYVYGYGDNLEQWLIDHIVVDGSIYNEVTWNRLDAVMGLAYPSESGEQLPIYTLGIDSGHEGPLVYKWAAKWPVDRVKVTKGEHTGNTYLRRGTPIEIMSGGGSKTRTNHVLYLAATTLLKDQCYGWLAQEKPTDEKIAEEGFPVGYTHFPRGATEEYFRQLTAETKVKGFYETTNYKRNEALDCKCIADAIAWLRGTQRYHALQQPMPVAAPAPAQPRAQFAPRPERGVRARFAL